MQDSFNQTPQGEAPKEIKTKSSKGWMICSIVLIVLLIGVSIFCGVLIAEKNNDAKRIEEMEQRFSKEMDKISEEGQKIEEKGAEIDEKVKDALNDDDDDEDGNEVDDEDDVKRELDLYIMAQEAKNGLNYTYKINKFSLTQDKKYYYAYITVTVKDGGSHSSVEYRAASGGKWANINGGQAVTPCAELSEKSLNFMKNYGKEVKNYMQCSDANGKVVDYSK